MTCWYTQGSFNVRAHGVGSPRLSAPLTQQRQTCLSKVRTGLLAHGRQKPASAGRCRRTYLIAPLNPHTPIVFTAINKDTTAASTGGILNALYQACLVNIIKCVKWRGICKYPSSARKPHPACWKQPVQHAVTQSCFQQRLPTPRTRKSVGR